MKLLAGDQLLIALFSLTFLSLLNYLNGSSVWIGQVALFAWLGGIGVLVGAILPLGLHGPGRKPVARRAGLLNAADYLGGTLGALAMASLFLPLYGSANSLRLIAVATLAAAALLLFEAFSNRSGPTSPSR